MINAKIHGSFGEETGFLVEFSDPNGNYRDAPEYFVTVRDKTDLLKRLYFKNRIYICDTLYHWFNQRMHACPDRCLKLKQLQLEINNARGCPYEALCALVARKMKEIESHAPSEISRMRNHYDKIISPILNECLNVYLGKAKVHYC